MSLLVTGALATIAKGALTAALGPFIAEARDATLSAAHDTIRSVVAGRMSIDEWAAAAITGVDKVKERVAEEGDLHFVGGKLKFAYSALSAEETVTISFQLYFLDELGKWQMASAGSDVPASKFTFEALDELRAEGKITFDVE